MEARKTEVDMSHWGPGVTHWLVGHTYYAVSVDDVTDGTMPKFITPYFKEIESFTGINMKTSQVLPRPTTFVRCDANGVAIDADTKTPAIELITEFTFPPGTTAEAALESLGCEVVS